MAGVENKPSTFPPSDLRLFQLPREMEQLLMAAPVAAGWQGGSWIPARSREAAPEPADALAARAASPDHHQFWGLSWVISACWCLTQDPGAGLASAGAV